jgi:hypothetical protein
MSQYNIAKVHAMMEAIRDLESIAYKHSKARNGPWGNGSESLKWAFERLVSATYDIDRLEEEEPCPVLRPSRTK